MSQKTKTAIVTLEAVKAQVKEAKTVEEAIRLIDELLLVAKTTEHEEKEHKKTFAALSGGNEMVTVQVDMFSPFVDFMKDYLAFFGSKKSLEDLCREMIYDDIKNLFNELHGWLGSTVSHVETVDFFSKYSFLGCVSDSKEELEESTKETED
jgi:hypothetical protein